VIYLPEHSGLSRFRGGIPLGSDRSASSVTRTRILPYLVVAAAFLVRVYRLDGQSLWFDEGYSLHLASQNVQRIVQETPVGWLPLHSLVLHCWLGLVGSSPFAARFFSVFLGVALVALLYLVGRALADHTTGMAAALLGTFSPFLLYYSQEARVYAFWLFFCLISFYALLWALRHPGRRKGWLLYAVTTAAALHSHYFSVFLLPWGVAVLSYDAVRRRRWRPLAVGLAAQAAALVSCMPLMGLARASVSDPYGFWRSPLSPSQVVLDLWYHFASGGNLPFREAAPAMLALAATAVLGMIAFRRNWGGALLASNAAIPVLGMLALSTWRELYVARYVAIAVPGVYLLSARGWSWLGRVAGEERVLVRASTLVVSVGLVGAIAVPWAEGLGNYYYSPEYARDDFRGAALYVAENERDGDVVVMSGGGISMAFLPYYTGRLPWVDLPPYGEWLGEAEVVEALNGLLAKRGGGRVWLVLSDNGITDPQNLIVAHLWTYGHVVEAKGFAGRTGVRVLLFSPRFDDGAFVFSPLAYQPLEASFDRQLEVLGYAIDGSGFAPGDDVHVALQWRALSQPGEDYHAFVHLLDGSGALVVGHDKVPLNQYFRPSVWPVGEPLRDEYVLHLPEDLSPGTYALEIGLYSYPSLRRLYVDGGPSHGADRVLLPSIVVQ
jgi:hypothetical protein